MDLAYAMLDGWDAVVLLDIAPRGEPPGTLSVVEPALDARRARRRRARHGPREGPRRSRGRSAADLPRTLVVACEPLTRMTGDEPDLVAVLSEPVRAALDAAVPLVEELLAELTTEDRPEGGRPS